MSILIKGMKMPEKCGSCDLFHVESPMHCTVVKGHKTVGAPYGMPRPDWCPLVEIPEPHGRLIDADALIEFCAERWIPLNIDAVNMQPTIQPEKAKLLMQGTTKDTTSDAIQSEPHWIPCSERMPEDYVDVLVWFEYFRYGNYTRMYATHGIGNYSKEYNSWAINHETGWKDLHVFAWMPLPEAYKPNK